MDLKQLEYFKMIVEEGNISQAAKKLYMSQPPLSNQMKLLERELGITLFERGSRQVVLTDGGKLLYERAKTILRLAEITKEEIRDLQKGMNGTIRLGIVSSVSDYFTLYSLPQFHQEFPNIKFEITEENTYELLSKLENGSIELAIVRTPFETTFEKIKLLEEQIVAVGDESLLPNSETSLSELSKKPLAIYRRWEEIITTGFQKKNLEILPQYLCDDARSCLSLAKSNLAIALVPESIVKAHSFSKSFLHGIKDLEIQTDISLVYNQKAFLSSPSKKLIDFLLYNKKEC